MSGPVLFRRVTLAFFFLALLGAASQAVLLLSDNPEYRYWGRVQIVLHIIAAGLLLFVRRFSLYSLLGLLTISLIIIFIDSNILDYGVSTIGFVVSWIVYFVVLKNVWSEFADSRRDTT